MTVEECGQAGQLQDQEWGGHLGQLVCNYRLTDNIHLSRQILKRVTQKLEDYVM